MSKSTSRRLNKVERLLPDVKATVPASSRCDRSLHVAMYRLCLQVIELLTAADANGQNILHWAASVGCEGSFAAVLEALRSRLTDEEVGMPVLQALLSLDMALFADFSTL